MGVHEGAQSAQKEARGIAREPLQRGARCYGTGVGVGVRRRCISFFLFSWPRGMRNLSSLARIAPISTALEVPPPAPALPWRPVARGCRVQSRASLVAQMVKNLPEGQETRV